MEYVGCYCCDENKKTAIPHYLLIAYFRGREEKEMVLERRLRAASTP
jgi:hypothetical protein